MKPLTFILTGFIAFTVLLGLSYAITRPVLSISIFKDAPQLTLVVWFFIICIPLAMTAQIMRMVYDVFKRRKC
jgi:hypothetical protein